MNKHPLPLSRRMSWWAHRHRWRLGFVAAVLVFLALVAGALDWWGGAIEPELWFQAASTMLAAAVAAGVALYVLGRQHQADDERDRRAREIDAAAALTAHINDVWRIADSAADLRDELPQFTLPPNALAELHRLVAVWAVYLDKPTLWASLTDEGRLSRAVLKFGDQVHAGVANGRDVVARAILEDSTGVDLVEQLWISHDALQEVGRMAVMLPWWDKSDRSRTLHKWIAKAESLPYFPRFVGTRANRSPDRSE